MIYVPELNSFSLSASAVRALKAPQDSKGQAEDEAKDEAGQATLLTVLTSHSPSLTHRRPHMCG